ncbi:hypothetical protein TRVA0_008S00606 [Trichomonascus vanleenenianus]|uniref:uncharacterized protein n=1 Tax=Trichomonascus vanleenenianus TaxID=2268995 RepID=UPI003ECB02EA
MMKDRGRSKGERRKANGKYPDELRDRLLACMGALRKDKNHEEDAYRYYGVTRGMVARHKLEFAFLQMRLSRRIDYMGLNYENAMFDAFVKLYERWNRPFSRGAVSQMAQKMKQELIIKYDQGTGEVPGPTPSWLARMEERFPGVAMGRPSQATGIDLLLREGEAKIWYKKFEELAQGIPAKNLAVMCETGFHFSSGGKKGVRTIMNVGSEPPDLDNGDHLALFECVLASGDVIPPLAAFISKREPPYEEESLVRDLETEFWGGKLVIARCDSYEDANRLWVLHYESISRKLAEESHDRCLLTMGHVWADLEQYIYAETKGIHYLSAHPLVRGAFDPLRNRYFELTKRFVNNLELDNVTFGGHGLAANELAWLSFYHSGADEISAAPIREGFEMTGLYPLDADVMTKYLFPGRNDSDRVELWSTTTSEAIQAELLRNSADDGEFTNALADLNKVLQYLLVAAGYFFSKNGTDFQDIKVKIMDLRSYVLTSYTLQEISKMEKDEELKPKVRDCFVDILSNSDRAPPVRGLNSKPRITTKERLRTDSLVKQEEEEDQMVFQELESEEPPRPKRTMRKRKNASKRQEASEDSDLGGAYFNSFDSDEDSSFKLSDDDKELPVLSSPPRSPNISSLPAFSPRNSEPKRRLSFEKLGHDNEEFASNPASPKLKHVIPASSSPLSAALAQHSDNDSGLSTPPSLSSSEENFYSDHDNTDFNLDIHGEEKSAPETNAKPQERARVSNQFATPPRLPDDDIQDASVDEHWIKVFENIYGDSPSIEKLRSEMPLLYHLSRSASGSARSSVRRIATSNGYEGTPLESKRSGDNAGDISGATARTRLNQSPRQSLSGSINDLSYVSAGEGTPALGHDRRGNRIYYDSPALESSSKSPQRKRRKLSKIMKPTHNGSATKGDDSDVPESILGIKAVDTEDGRSLKYRTAWRNKDQITYEPLSTFKQHPGIVKGFYDQHNDAERPKELARFLAFSLFLNRPAKKKLV